MLLALTHRFGVEKQELWFRAQLRRRTRGAGETLPSLAQDIERLVYLSYPSAPQELRDSLSCDHFLDALQDVDLQIAVRQGHPSTMQEALASTIEIDAIRRSVGLSGSGAPAGSDVLVRKGRGSERVGPTSDEPSTAQTLTEIWHALENLQQTLAKSSPVGQHNRGSGRIPTQGSRTLGACWGCGNMGHFRRNCPRRVARAGDATNQQRSENRF